MFFLATPHTKINTRRQTAGLSPLIKVSKKNRKKTVPEPVAELGQKH